jgi:hypothetical protein
VADDNVIEHFNAEQLPCLDDLTRHLDIFR